MPHLSYHDDVKSKLLWREKDFFQKFVKRRNIFQKSSWNPNNANNTNNSYNQKGCLSRFTNYSKKFV